MRFYSTYNESLWQERIAPNNSLQGFPIFAKSSSIALCDKSFGPNQSGRFDLTVMS
jgi:hypothetical protein